MRKFSISYTYIVDMADPGTPTLDQLRVLTAVAGAGSFSAAARQLNRTQSVVSYTIANLEAQLGVAVFERRRHRPVLTDAGRAVLADARRIGMMVDELRARAGALTRGLEAEVSLAVDVMFPTTRLVRVLEAFAHAFPTVTLRLRIEALGGTTQLVIDRDCSVGVSGWMSTRFAELERRVIGTASLISVCAPTHPLAALAAPLPAPALREHVQLVLTDRSRLSDPQDFGVYALRTWRLGDLGSKHALLRAGLGWGNMPHCMVEDDIASGRLVRLTLAEADSVSYPLILIHRADAPPGTAGRWLGDKLAEGEAGEIPGGADRS